MLSEFLKDYLPIILFLVIALGLSVAFVVLNFLLSPKKPDPEKLSADNFSGSGFFGESKKFNTTKATLKPRAITKNRIIGR